MFDPDYVHCTPRSVFKKTFEVKKKTKLSIDVKISKNETEIYNL